MLVNDKHRVQDKLIFLGIESTNLDQKFIDVIPITRLFHGRT